MSILTDKVTNFISQFKLPRGYYMSSRIDSTGTEDIFLPLIPGNNGSQPASIANQSLQSKFFGMDMRMIFILNGGIVVDDATVLILQTIAPQFQKYQIHIYQWGGPPEYPEGSPPSPINPDLVEAAQFLRSYGINCTYQGVITDQTDLNSLFIIKKTFHTPFTTVDPDQDNNQDYIPF